MRGDAEVVLITKTVTQNQGNQALSVALRDLLERTYPKRPVRPIERVPVYLKQFRLAALARSPDPISAFERIARKLVRRVPSGPKPPVRRDIRHDAGVPQARRFLALRRRVGVRSWLARLGAGKGAYLERLSILRDAALVVVNPAGEFYPGGGDTVISYLLDLRCAQLLGARTALVNVSLEVRNPVLRRLIIHALDQADLIEFRDSQSLEVYRSAGGRRTPLVLPDAAILTRYTGTAPARVGATEVGLAINGPQARAARLEAGWHEVVDRVIASGQQPVLISNEWSTDEPYWRPLVAGGRVRSLGRDADYQAYMDILRGFEVVVSSRLHTCILSIAAGTPVIPVETGTFKLSGFFQQIGLGDEPISLTSPAWVDLVLERLAQASADRARIIELQARRREAALARLETEFSRVLQNVLR